MTSLLEREEEKNRIVRGEKEEKLVGRRKKLGGGKESQKSDGPEREKWLKKCGGFGSEFFRAGWGQVEGDF